MDEGDQKNALYQSDHDGSAGCSAELNEFFWDHITDEDRAYLCAARPNPAPCTCCGGLLTHYPLCMKLQGWKDMALKFGKHKGRKLSDVDSDYLRWAYDNFDSMDSETKEAILAYLISIGETPID